MPPAYANFLLASTSASAALIGLLFVSISIEPRRLFGERAEPTRQALALSSFTALTNVFFVSFGSLIPNVPLGPLVVVPGLIAGSQTLALLTLIPRWRHDGTLVRGLLLLGISAAIYTYEIGIGVRFWFATVDPGSLTNLLELVLAIYAIGLGRAWQLLGGPHGRGVGVATIGWLRARMAGKRRPEAHGR